MFDNTDASVSALPKSVRIRSFFLIDLKTFDFRDVKADDNGVFINNGQPTTYYKIRNLDDRSLRYYMKLDKEKFQKKAHDSYFI